MLLITIDIKVDIIVFPGVQTNDSNADKRVPKIDVAQPESLDCRYEIGPNGTIN